MKVLLIINLFSISISISISISTGDNINLLEQTKAFNTTEGMQIYFLDNPFAYYYVTLTGDETKITIEANLYLTTSKEEIIDGNGVWAGIGFGTSRMLNSDMVIFTNVKNSFSCYDAFFSDYTIHKDQEIGANNDVTFESGEILALDSNDSYAPYVSLTKWKCSKDITNLDKNDWAKFKTWKSNLAPVIGAFGKIGEDGEPEVHRGHGRSSLILRDGEGYMPTKPKIKNSNNFFSYLSNFITTGNLIVAIALLLVIVVLFLFLGTENADKANGKVSEKIN